ncbi:MAG: choice-of-anchor Q domain-containing protein [Pirellulales bacterium]
MARTSGQATTSIQDSVVADNASQNPADRGGGVFAYTSAGGRLDITRTTISGSAADSGGGIVTTSTGNATVTMLQSTVSGNFANSYGGGITIYNYFGSEVTISESSISGNSSNARGGGVDARTYVEATTTFERSTISGNTANTEGGGVRTLSGRMGMAVIHGSTLSGNVAPTGGGILNFSGATDISHTTITLNQATDGAGSGIATRATSDTVTSVQSSVVAGNVNSDIDAVGEGPVVITSLGYNIVGEGNQIPLFTEHDQTGVTSPLLAPLAANGGPTLTHLPLPGSPVIDAGDPAILTPPAIDQRGFYRIVDGDGDGVARIDVGAVESSSPPPLAGDGNLDGTVDELDYILWKGFFHDNPAHDPPAAPQNGDYNDDGVVDGLDYLVWADNYGRHLETVASMSSSAEEQSALSVAFEDDDASALVIDDLLVMERQLSRAFDAVLGKAHEKRKCTD